MKKSERDGGGGGERGRNEKEVQKIYVQKRRKRERVSGALGLVTKKGGGRISGLDSKRDLINREQERCNRMFKDGISEIFLGGKEGGRAEVLHASKK